MASTDWRKIALESVPDPNQHIYIVASLGLGAIVAGIATPIAGGLAAMLGCLCAYRRGERAAKFDEAILVHSKIAPALTKDNLKGYLDEVGLDRVIAEIKWAENNEYPVSDSCIDLLESQHVNNTDEQEIPIQQTATTLVSPPNDADPLNNPKPSADRQNNTVVDRQEETDAQRLERIFGSAENPSRPTLTKDTIRTIQLGDKESEPFDLIDSILKNLSSMLFLAMPGCGKGMLVSNLLKEFKKRNPDSVIIVIDPKGSKKEVGYWDSIADILWRKQIRFLDPADKVQWIKDGWQIFEDECIKADGNYPVIVFLDEMLAVGMEFGSKDSFLQSKIKDVVSMGPSEQCYCWVATQSPAVADLGISSAIGNQLKKVIIAKAEYSNMMKAWMANSYPLVKGFDFTSIDRYIAASPVGRAVLFEVDGKWRPMEKMENNSGYDRDTKTYSNPSQSTTQNAPAIVEVVEVVEVVEESPELPQDTTSHLTEPITNKPYDSLDDSNRDEIDSSQISLDKITVNKHSEAKTTTEVNIKPMSQVEIAILNFFTNVEIQRPKSLNQITTAASIRKLENRDNLNFRKILEKMVEEEKIVSPVEGFWALESWISRN